MAIIPDQKTGNISFQTPQDKKRQKMTYILSLVIIVTLGVIYFGFFSEKGSEVSVAPVSSGYEILPENDILIKKLDGIRLKGLLFQDKKFQSLILFGQFPVNIGVKGRNNPFEPF